MKITVLIENTTHNELVCEHGLSFYIEHEGKKYLLDSGSSDAFMANAEKLGIDLGDIDRAFLSHGHYDHSGGFKAFHDAYPDVRIMASEHIFRKHCSAKGGMHDIGVDENDKEVFSLISGQYDMGKVHFIPHEKPLTHQAEMQGMYQDGVYDDLMHEYSLVFETDKGLVLFNSCSHGGVKQIVMEAEEALHQKVYAYLGGLHLKGRELSESEISELVEQLRKIPHVYTGHCTGEEAMCLLQGKTDNIHELYSGQVIEL